LNPLNGKPGISPVMAIKLDWAFNTSPHCWLNLQGNYDLWQVFENDEKAMKVKTLLYPALVAAIVD
jgi:plasmid maintenance system antidote protein VapI